MAASNGNGVSQPNARPDTVTLSRKAWNWLTVLGSAGVLAVSSTLWGTVTSVNHLLAAVSDIREDDERLDREMHEELERLRTEVSTIRNRQYSEHAEFRRDINSNKTHIVRHEAQCAERHRGK